MNGKIGVTSTRAVVGASFAALALLMINKSWWLHYPDLGSYPFITYDGFQWILEGLHLRGFDVPTWGRNPGFPIIIATLDLFHAMRLLPLVHVALLAIFLVQLFRFARLYASPGAAALATLLIGASFSVQTSFDFILADPWAVTLLVSAFIEMEQAHACPRRMLTASVLCAASFWFQYAIAFALPAFALFVFLRVVPEHQDTRLARWLIFWSAVLGCALIAPIFIYKEIHYGDPLWTKVVQFQLVRFHLSGVPFYLYAGFFFLGIPAALVAAAGLGAARHAPRALVLPLSALASQGAFWILFYDWLDARFLLYLLPSGAVCLALGIDRIGFVAALTAPNSLRRQMLAGGALSLALCFAGYPRGDPFARGCLPLSPWHALVFDTRGRPDAGAEMEWSHRPHLTSAGGWLPALRFWVRWWRSQRPAPSPLESEELDRMMSLAERDQGTGVRVSECLSALSGPTDLWRREIAMRRSIGPCGSPSDVVLRDRGAPTSGPLLGEGARYKLERASRSARAPTPTDGAR